MGKIKDKRDIIVQEAVEAVRWDQGGKEEAVSCERNLEK